MNKDKMIVVKRNGEKQAVSFDKIIWRLGSLCDMEPKIKNIDHIKISQKVVSQIYSGISTSKLDELAAEICTASSTIHPNFGKLASRIIISNNHKLTSPSFSETVYQMYNNLDKHKKHNPLISEEIYNLVMYNKQKLNSSINYQRDYDFDYFGFKTLEKAYLIKINGKTVERIQHLFLRVSLGIHKGDISKVLETYDYMSQKYFIHATPTLFHSSTNRPQMLSCFLLGMEDSVDGIYKCLRDCAKISKWAGGIGIWAHDIRSDNSVIRSTNGKSNGLIPMLRVFNETARHINQSGKRQGSFAIYLETWHSDIFEFLEAKKNHGDENARARDLFYALWISDLFMERVRDNGMWALMCPDKCRGLTKVYGEDFNKLYCEYERLDDHVFKRVKAQELWEKILISQIETGTPYICYKDAANRKTNQQNIGTISSSNLCVAPETKILTDDGYFEIQSLVDKDIRVWNGNEFSETKVRKTGENQDLMNISFDDGSNLTCTPYHKFHVYKNDNTFKNKKAEEVEAKELRGGMALIKCDFPTINSNDDLEYAYTNGFFSGDGTYQNIHTYEPQTKCNFKCLEGKSYCKRHIRYQTGEDTNDNDICKAITRTKKPAVTLYGEKIKLLEYLDYHSCGEVKNNKLNVLLNVNLKDKFYVPINSSLKSKMEWLSGYADADGTLTKTGSGQNLQICSIDNEFLFNIKLMLQTCGINSKVTKSRDGWKSYLPDGKGGKKYYDTKTQYRLHIASYEVNHLKSIGFSPKRLLLKDNSIEKSGIRYIKVAEVKHIERKSDTYCFNEPKRHTGIFNGVISGQCSEILEFSDHNQYACCTLASIGLPKYVEPYDYNNITEIILFGKESCKFCKYSKNYLDSLGLKYQYLDIEEDEKNKEFMYMLKPEEAPNTVPQIFVAYGDNTKDYIGGFSELITFFKPKYNFKELYKVAKIITYNLNKVIDINYYPVPETRYSNKLHRPIGIGVQGLADVYSLMRVGFDSPEAHELNKEIFATIYYGSMEASMEIAKERNIHLEKILELRGDFKKHKYTRANEYEKCIDDIFTWKTGDSNKNLECKELEEFENEYLPIDEELYNINENDEITSIKNLKYIGSYSSFEGSPLSKGKFQFDLWNEDPVVKVDDFILDWESLRENVLKYGARNSLLIAPMPTASTSQILGNNECIEPLTSNIYSRNTIAGSFVVINQYLLNDLINIGIWSNDIKDEIILNSGSIQNINAIPDKIKSLYKISWDLSQKTLIDQAAERGVYVCQSQSLNLFLKDPDFSKLTSMHFYAWSKGIKTGIYYLRTKAAAKAQQFTIEPEKENSCLSCSA